MNYAGKKIAITGADGFIGKALIKKLQEDYGYTDGCPETTDIHILNGDTRDPRTFDPINHTFICFTSPRPAPRCFSKLNPGTAPT